MTKCLFHQGGRSLTVERHDALCILPLNVVNEKIYIFLWFWFVLLTFLSLLTLLYRIGVIISPRIRGFLLATRFRLLGQDAVQNIVRKSRLGDWFLLYMLGQNIDSVIFKVRAYINSILIMSSQQVVFKEVIQDLSRRLSHPKDFGEP